MSEELPNLPSNDAAPPEAGTGSEEAKSVPADAPASGEQNASTEGVHPEGENKEPAGNAATNEEPFYSEGGKVFKTKDEYIRHVNKQRGAASRLAFEKSKLERELQEKNQLLEKLLANGGQPQQGQQKQDEPEDEETKQVLAELKRRGKFISSDELEEILSKKFQNYEPIIKKVQEQEREQAQAYVDNFLEVNPDAIDSYEQIVDTMTRMQQANVPCSIEQAYFLVTGKAALAAAASATQKPAAPSPVSPVKAAKQAQAGAGSSNASSAAGGVKRDFMDEILTSL